jgi:hypothetical protein
LVLWSDHQHFDIIAQMGLASAVEQLLAMRRELMQLDDEELEAACDDCQDLAEAIIRYWPDRQYQHRVRDRDSQPWLNEFAHKLLSFDDPDLLGRLLRTLAERDPVFPLERLVPAALKRMGSAAIAPHLLELIKHTPQRDPYGYANLGGLAERDALWLFKLSRSGQGNLTSETLHQLLDLAVAKLEQHAKELEKRSFLRGNGPTTAWTPLCKAAVSSAAFPQLDRLIQLTNTCPKVFDLREFQVPTAKTLSTWADKNVAERPSRLQDWIESIKQQLRSDTQDEPVPPGDLQRCSDTKCSCPFCRQLAEFLRDPQQESTRISAREEHRGHLEQVIRERQLDISSELDRTSRPYALRLTKTTATYQRALKKYQSDLKLLASLESRLRKTRKDSP